MLKIRPLGDRLIVRQSKAAEKIGLIHVPDSAQEKNAEGEVLAVGPGRFRESFRENGPVRDYERVVAETGPVRLPMEMKVGDRVLYSKYGGQVLKLDGEEYLVIKSDDVLGIFEAP